MSIQGRDRVTNLAKAKAEMTERLDAQGKKVNYDAMSKHRRELRGSGERGDKIRTIRFQDDTATDHRSGKQVKAEKYLRGGMCDLW